MEPTANTERIRTLTAAADSMVPNMDSDSEATPLDRIRDENTTLRSQLAVAADKIATLQNQVAALTPGKFRHALSSSCCMFLRVAILAWVLCGFRPCAIAKN